MRSFTPVRDVAHRSLSDGLARYRAAQNVLRSPASRHDRYGLDWMNFFIADVQTGFGSFVAFYLAGLG